MFLICKRIKFIKKRVAKIIIFRKTLFFSVIFFAMRSIADVCAENIDSSSE
jgi:hypothetical protein